MVACSKITLRVSVFCGKLKNWDRIAPSHSYKFGKEKGPSQGIMQKCEPQERKPCAHKFEDKTLLETMQQERCARREAWDLAKHLCKFQANPRASRTCVCASTPATRVAHAREGKANERPAEVWSLKNYQGGRNLTQKLSRGPTIWKDLRKSSLKDTVSWRIKKVRTVVQSLNSMLGRPSVQKKR